MQAIESGTTGTNDVAAIEDLDDSVRRQREAFQADPFPSLDERRMLLASLAEMVMSHRVEIEQAMSADFGVHPKLATDMVEVLGVASRAGFAAEQLEGWMAPEPRYSDPAIYGSGRAFVQPQPKGVIGNISPWNFPFDLSLGPLIEMLAAGNRVVLKPSEHAPNCAAVLRDMVRTTFDRDRVDVVVGGLELAKAFTRVRWDHLLYTGSPEIGRQIAMTAAEQLVPVTLELGGKNPAIVTRDSINVETVKQVLSAKAVKSGQMCISVDYCLVPRERMEEFAGLAAGYVRESMPGFHLSEDNAGIINALHVERIEGLIDEARTRGCDVRSLEQSSAIDPDRRQMPMSLVLDPPDDIALMREEIFGPILAIRPYDELDDAIESVNAGERPLALYVFSQDEGVADEVLRRTSSGGACVNSAAVHGSLASLPFGGIGQSGSGRHHGIEGFREFSNPRGVFVRGQDDVFVAFAPPYGETTQAIVDAGFGTPGTADHLATHE